MKREDIKEAAVNYDSRLVAFRAFMKGAEWRINSVWHDSSDEPEIAKLVLFETETRGFLLGKVYKKGLNKDWKKWAYVDDLKPNMEE